MTPLAQALESLCAKHKLDLKAVYKKIPELRELVEE